MLLHSRYCTLPPDLHTEGSQDAFSCVATRFQLLLDKEKAYLPPWTDFASPLQLHSFERLHVSKHGSKQLGKQARGYKCPELKFSQIAVIFPSAQDKTKPLLQPSSIPKTPHTIFTNPAKLHVQISNKNALPILQQQRRVLRHQQRHQLPGNDAHPRSRLPSYSPQLQRPKIHSILTSIKKNRATATTAATTARPPATRTPTTTLTLTGVTSTLTLTVRTRIPPFRIPTSYVKSDFWLFV
jgi:hypothetical protein